LSELLDTFWAKFWLKECQCPKQQWHCFLTIRILVKYQGRHGQGCRKNVWQILTYFCDMWHFTFYVTFCRNMSKSVKHFFLFADKTCQTQNMFLQPCRMGVTRRVWTPSPSLAAVQIFYGGGPDPPGYAPEGRSSRVRVPLFFHCSNKTIRFVWMEKNFSSKTLAILKKIWFGWCTNSYTLYHKIVLFNIKNSINT